MAVELQDEEQLVSRARGGDRAALGVLLRTYGPILYRSILLPRLGNRALAEEALSMTYTRVVERVHGFEWQGHGIYPWLRTVALHVAIDLVRKRRRELLFSPEDLERQLEGTQRQGEATPGAEEQERRDLEYAQQQMQASIGALHPRYAQVLRLRVLEERPRAEVAETMGVAVGTLDVLLHRATVALRKAMRPMSSGVSGKRTGKQP